MYSPLPPCCSVPYFRRTCEDSSTCNECGKFGIMGNWFDKNRGYVMLFAAFLSFFGCILQLIAVLSISTRDSTVKATAWTYGESNYFQIWVGLSEVIYKQNGVTTSILWDEHNCVYDYCHECKESCDSTYNAVIVSLVTSVPQLLTDIQRSTSRGDLNCQKVMGVVTGIIGTLSTLSSLSLYANGCLNNLPTTDGLGNSIDYTYGPGFACLLLATLLKPIDVFVHLVTPVIREKDTQFASMDDALREKVIP